MIHPFELNIRTEKSLCWRFERKMLHFMAMSIHYKIRRNNNTDLKISRIQLQILSIHGKDINTFSNAYASRKIQAWFFKTWEMKKRKRFHDKTHFLCKKRNWMKTPQNVQKWIFYAQIISIEYFIVAWVEMWVDFLVLCIFLARKFQSYTGTYHASKHVK